MNHSKKYQILLLADVGHHTGCLSDHIRSITHGSPHQWHIENPLTCKILHKLDLSKFDAIGIHYSIRPHHYYYMPKSLYNALKQYQGPKFLFLQDEYHHVKAVENCILDLGIHLMFTLVRPELISKAYPRLKHVDIVSILTGYVPDYMLTMSAPPIKDRTLDIFYRSRINEYWLGELAQDKVVIAEGILKRAAQYGLTVDVSVREEDRIYGNKWFERLASTKAVLATESGASIWDYDGHVEALTRHYLHQHPAADFKEVQRAVLQPYEGNILYSAISPRIFEAAAVKTPLIMFPGWYSGVCQPNTHYIPLEKDFSNMEDVVAKLKDIDYLQSLANRTHYDLIQSNRYAEHQLMEVVNHKIEHLLMNKEFQHSHSDLAATILSLKKKHRVLNFIQTSLAEAKFVVCNIYKLLTDKRYSIGEKGALLFKGGCRYFVYIIPRYFASSKN